MLTTRQTISSIDRYAIESKTACSCESLRETGSLVHWLDKLRSFRQRLNNSNIQGLIFDYDGTLINSNQANDRIRLELVKHILYLLDSGIPVGVATGRGPSVRHEMRRNLPSRLYSRVLIGYYSGDQVGNLNQTNCPDQSDSVCEELQPFLAILDQLRMIARVTFRRRQIIAEPSSGINVMSLWQQVSDLIEHHSLSNIRVVRSCRSVDILAPNVSKASLLKHMRNTYDFSGPILCVGDQGSSAGNDYDLLSTPYSLSVDQVSSDPNTCWNLTMGISGVRGTLYYLNQMMISEPGVLHINL